MKCGLLIRSRAETDITEAALWYEQHHQGFGEEFLQEVGHAIDRSRQNPRAFQIIRRKHEVRRAVTRRFPYLVFFSLRGATVIVHTVLHGSQHERRLDERL